MRKHKQEEQKETFRRANADLLAEQERQRQRDHEEEKRIELYGKKKDDLDQLKKDR